MRVTVRSRVVKRVLQIVHTRRRRIMPLLVMRESFTNDGRLAWQTGHHSAAALSHTMYLSSILSPHDQ